MKLKLREKTTATLLIAIIMISIVAVAIPAIAQDLEKPEARASAIGQFTSLWGGWTGYPHPSTLGDRCLVSVHARRTAIGWTGQGVFRDKDYELTATLTIDGAQEIVSETRNQVILRGDAEVYIDDVYDDVYRFFIIIVDTDSFNYVSFEIPYLPYLACVYGADISVKTTVNVPLE